MIAGKKVKVTCLECGTTNNVPVVADNKKVLCGRCRVELPPSGKIVEPLPQQVYKLFHRSAIPLLVDFYSMTSISSELMYSIVLNLAERRKGELMVIRSNVDEHPELSSAFGVQEVPTFLILFRGNERARYVGEMTEMDFSLWVAKYT